jgi:TonB-linked SusC/RagA family outer membrane protein
MKENYFYLFKYGLSILLLICAVNTFAQQGPFTGKVVDDTDHPVPGASVHIKGTTTATVTDGNGQFRINSNQNNITVIVNFIGYVTVEKEIKAGQPVTIQMRLNGASLDEVVVVGYGTSKKSDVTGAITTVSSKDFNAGPITNPLQQLEGHAAGVVITQTGSEPGSSPSIRIRGQTSINGGNNPLVVVDGVQSDLSILNSIPPSEIESTEILKDASATAIYGSRGANGVIIITTKKNKHGRPTIEYTDNSSVDAISKSRNFFTAAEWGAAALANGLPASINHGANTDWFKALLQNGLTQNHTLAFGNSGDGFSYRASLTAIEQTGVVLTTNSQRYIGRIDATQKALDDKLTLTMTLNDGISQGRSEPGIGIAAFSGNAITYANEMRPTDPIYNPDGTYYNDPAIFQYQNPLAAINNIRNDNSQENLFGSLRANLKIFKGFSGEVFGSWRKTDSFNGSYTPVISQNPGAISANGIASITNSHSDEKLFDGQLNYTTDWGKNHFDALAVYEYQLSTSSSAGETAKNFINDIATYNALQLGDITKASQGDISSNKNDRKLVSFLGRVNYSYMDRYLITGSIRRDGSSVFGANHKWGNFGSGALRWKVGKELFMQDQKIFNSLDLRVGYGVTGNQGINPQQSLQLVAGSGTVAFGGVTQVNFATNQNANPDLRWETNKQTNLAIDFTALNNRLSVTFEAYNKITDNLLASYTVPQPPFPTGSITANIGSMQNRGLEFTANYYLIKNSTTTLTIGGNATFMDSKVLNLSGTLNGIPLTTTNIGDGLNAYYVVGHAIGSINILQHLGRTSTGAETIVDQDGNGSIDNGATSKDRVYEGQINPKYVFAFTPSFTYKNFDAALVWTGSGGNKIYNSYRQNFSLLQNLGKSNLLESSLATNLFSTAYSSDEWLESGAYMRLQSVAIGYRIPFKNKYISSFRVSATGQNLLTITKYSGIDPEVYGTDGGIFPRTRTYGIGLNIILK